MQRLTYIIIILGIITLFTGQSFSQDMKFTLRGMVISEESQKPLIGVTIQDTVSGAGRISDRDGKFQMEIEKLPVVLVFRHLGYFEDTLRIKNKKQYKEYIEGKTIIISLRVNPFLLDEVVVSDSRIAVKLFEKEPYSIIDFVVRDNRFYAFGYKNYNPLRREVFLGDHSGRILDSRSLPGTNEIYMDCQGEIYAVTSDTAYIFSKSSDLIEITPVCRTEFFYQMVKPIKALDEDSFIFLEKSEEGRFHDYSIGNAENNKLEVFYRVGSRQKEQVVKSIDKKRRGEELGKIRRGFISGAEMRIINSRIQGLLYSIFHDYPPVDSDMFQMGDTVLLFDYDAKEIHCFNSKGERRWATDIKIDLNRDFTGRAHFDRISQRYFLEFTVAQLSYLIEIDPDNGRQLMTVPIRKFKHIDHISIFNNRIFFLHQPDFGDRGKKIYFLDI